MSNKYKYGKVMGIKASDLVAILNNKIKRHGDWQIFVVDSVGIEKELRLIELCDAVIIHGKNLPKRFILLG